jgi:acyl carrier protein
LDEVGFRAMDDARAFEILSAAVREGSPRLMVANLDVARVCETHQARGARAFLEELARARPAAGGAAGSAESPSPGLREALAAMPLAERRDRMNLLVRGEAARVMGLAEPEAIDATKGFFELGFDSLMAVRLRHALSAQLGETLPATLTFKYPTVAKLSEHLAVRLGGEAAQPAPAPYRSALAEAADADIQKLLQAELDSLPEDLR